MKEYFKNKKIIILGFGKEGKSTYNYIRKYEKDIILHIMDNNYEKIELSDKKVIISDIDYDLFQKYDMIIKTPGISLKNVDISSFANKITSQLQIFLETTTSYTIGITGSKGKSTTSSLIYEIIKNEGYKTYLVGNIGLPIFDVMDEIDSETYTVIEMSAHQLEYIEKSPNIALILNLYPEHLDHYKSLEYYYKAKLNIAKYQNKDDYFLYFGENDALNMYQKMIETNAFKYLISLNKKDNSYTYLKDNFLIVNDYPVFDINTKINLQGEHYLIDIAFALTVANILLLENDSVIKTIKEFKGLPHRLEKVGTFKNITYYNDSIATIPQSTINGIKTLKNVNTLIVGGKDRGVDQSDLISFLKKSDVKNIICLPDTGNIIYNALENDKNVFKADIIEEAAQIAMDVTEENTICLLSPAASSYGFYQNFEERGNRYKEYIQKEGQ